MPEQLPLAPQLALEAQSAEKPRVRPVSASVTSSSIARRKELGAFYTPPAMAEKLVEWAVQSPDDHVFDPSFGGLAFLRAAGGRLVQLGAAAKDTALQLHGMELDSEAFRAATSPGDTDVPTDGLLLGDFFASQPCKSIPLCQAVVGNPPYIRYQEFKRSSAAAHRITERAGIRLTRLASSWAPFLIHATAFVAPGGRMAQVLPAELLHAQYAGGVTDFLRRSFSRVTIAIFDERVFPGALEEVVLLFADDRGDRCDAEIQLLSCDSLDDLTLEKLDVPLKRPPSGRSGERFGRDKLLVQLLPSGTQDLYRALCESDEVARMGDLAEVNIGAVTGANDFFLLADIEAEGFAPDLLRPAVSKAMQIRGARYSQEDHDQLAAAGRKAQLLVARADMPPAVIATAEAHLAAGREAGIHNRYKCRTRDPWWAVPLPRRAVPDLLLTYCASEHPRLVLNEAGVVQTNTIHGVHVNALSDGPALAAGFFNSLTLLSAELVGRSYGGGVLKLEPTEAERLVIPSLDPDVANLLPEVDRRIRDRDLDSALNLVDPVVLGSGLGMSDAEIRKIRAGAARLRARRRSRSSRRNDPMLPVG